MQAAQNWLRDLFSSTSAGRPDTDGLGAPKVVEQFARLKRREDGVDGKTKELESRLCESERLVRELQKEVTVLKTAIEKLQVRKVELESQNRKLEQDLDAAEAKIKRMEKIDQVWNSTPCACQVMTQE